MHFRPVFHIALFSFAVSLWTSPVKAESWKKTYQLSGMPALAITADDADIRVSSWASSKIEATVQARHQESLLARTRIDERQVGNSVSIAVRKRSRAITLLDLRVDRPIVDVHMPASGHVILKTGDGDIRVFGVRGDIDLRTGDGSQDISDSAGSLRSIAGDGNVHVKGVFGSVQITAKDGSVDLYATAGSHLDADWRIQTGDGDVRVALPRELSANVDVQTGDGSISTALPVTLIGQASERQLKGILAKGGHTLIMRVGDGKIVLREAT